MILVIGGASSGKTSYVLARLRDEGRDASCISDAVIDERPVVDSLQRIVAADPDAAPALFDALVGKDFVVCDEVGSGIVPATPEGREAREQTGRLCIRLAAAATQVVRLVAGVPTILKDSR